MSTTRAAIGQPLEMSATIAALIPPARSTSREIFIAIPDRPESANSARSAVTSFSARTLNVTNVATPCDMRNPKTPKRWTKTSHEYHAYIV